jgi:hypothetical protein
VKGGLQLGVGSLRLAVVVNSIRRAICHLSFVICHLSFR